MMGAVGCKRRIFVLFQAALGLSEPWQVVSVEFDPEAKRLDLRVDFAKGARFACPECERAGLKVHDTEEKTWRHLDFFQHQAYLTARVPRVDCPEHKVRLVAVPWARERSGFTLLFEALVMAMVREMPVATLAGLVGESDMRIWRIVHHYVDQAVEAQNLDGVERVGIDETSSRARARVRVGVRRPGRAPWRVRASRAAITRRCRRSRCSWRRTAATRPRSGGVPGHVRGVPEGHADAPPEGGDHVRPLPRQVASLKGRRRGPPRGGQSITASCWRTRGTCGSSGRRT